jgi:hypothetical protein
LINVVFAKDVGRLRALTLKQTPSTEKGISLRQIASGDVDGSDVAIAVADDDRGDRASDDVLILHRELLVVRWSPLDPQQIGRITAFLLLDRIGTNL